ncbi:LemA family protein [Baaleninema simplex]|uniref:LemA family protein n=1 Tax=Baaleninema simplex TaxID=2862350 RepID=UPI000348A7D0|nr:LemA family protein [Baaleninema simplex]
MWTLIISIVVVILLAVWITGLYNSLIRSKNQIDNAFSSIDVILKKRYDLIPNLVAVAKKYSDFEIKTLTRVSGLRSQAMSRRLPNTRRLELENQISREISNFLVTVEAYPQLKADRNFLQLQASLNEVEEQLSAARRFYNSAVTEYNNAIEMFPTNIIATQLNYRRKKVFEASESDRQNVNVSQLFEN